MMNVAHEQIENAAPELRFAFGKNWSRFLHTLDEDRIRAAERSLQQLLHLTDLRGLRFLDVGSGSGLFSLAARRLGATVRSFDYDVQSVECTRQLKRRYFPDDPGWIVEPGSALDEQFVRSLGQSDIVYSWGVLHHTGAMYKAFGLIVDTVAPNGMLCLAIYNDQGWISSYWGWVKRTYNRSSVGKTLMTLVHAPYLFGVRWTVRAAAGRLRLERGMSMWYDMVDWLGGHPFEVARPETIFRYFRDRKFVLHEINTCGGRQGCNEFVFRRAR